MLKVHSHVAISHNNHTLVHMKKVRLQARVLWVMTLRISDIKLNNSIIMPFFYYYADSVMLSVVALIVVMLNVVGPFQAANASYWIVKTHFEIGCVNDP